MTPAAILAHADGATLWPAGEAGAPPADIAAAYQAALAVRALRVARGERPAGYKIGFTNRTIWDEYGIDAPIWGDMLDSTVHPIGTGRFSLGRLVEPRIEPEIAFGIGRAPSPDMDEVALLGCIDWVAHGFEIVQSIFPNWSFSPADTVAAYGLHGALFTGPWHDITANRDEWFAKLPAFEIDLYRNGELADHGQASNVLDGPLTALRHLISVLAEDPSNPQIEAGEIVTTGTLTRAFPVEPGETWSTVPGDIPFEGISITFR